MMVILQRYHRWQWMPHHLISRNFTIACSRIDNLGTSDETQKSSTSAANVHPRVVQPRSCFAEGRQIGSSVLNCNKSDTIRCAAGWYCKTCNIAIHTLLQIRNLSNGAHHHHHHRHRDPDMRNCKSIEELTQMAYDSKDIMSPRGMSAYWTLVLKHLPRRGRQAENKQMQMQIDELIGKSLRSIGSYGYRDLAQTAISLSKIMVKVSTTYWTLVLKHLPRRGGPAKNSQMQMQIDELIGKSLRSIETYDPRDMSTLAISLAKIMDKVDSSGMGKGSSQQILNDVLIGPNSDNKQFIFNKLAAASVPILYEFDARSLSNLIYAFGLAKVIVPVKDGRYFDMLAEVAIMKLNKIANFLWASATNGQDQNLFSSLTPSVKANLDKYDEQSLSNIAWAYAVADVDAPSIFDDTFISACLRKEDEFINGSLRQLHQWQLWQDELKSNIQLPQSLMEKCYNTFISENPHPSKLHDDVIASLISIGLELEEEVLTKSGYRLDAAVELNGKQVGVEVDGPSHFVGSTRTPTGSTILKHRQVVNIDGIQLVSVPYWEWDKFKNDSQKKQQYLRKLLGLD